jgi:uncharacterized protein with HEPN domain
MSDRKPAVIIEDILKCIEHIQLYSSNLSFEKFSSNFMVVEACLYNIQIIGEAVSHLPEAVKKDNPKIPWTLIKGIRNRLIHEYFGTDLQVIWEVIKDELPILENELRVIHASLI